MKARTAMLRQRLIEETLAGMKAILVDDKTLLQEMDPEQEKRFKLLVTQAVLMEYHEI